MAKVRVEGLDEWVDFIESIPQEVEDKVKQHVAMTGYKIEADAKRLVPEDTGHLKRNIETELENVKKQRYSAIIGTNVEYAHFVEFGTSRTIAKPYLIPALLKHEKDFAKGISDIVKRAGD